MYKVACPCSCFTLGQEAQIFRQTGCNDVWHWGVAAQRRFLPRLEWQTSQAEQQLVLAGGQSIASRLEISKVVEDVALMQAWECRHSLRTDRPA